MTILDALWLGLIQGLTEFLPVSSSGHLVLGRHFLGVPPGGGAAFEVMLHLGSLLSIVTVFPSDFRGLAGEAPVLLRPDRWRAACRERPHFRLLALILLSAVPAGILGVLLHEQLEATFAEPRLVAWLLLVTAGLLLATRFAPRGDRTLSAGSALAMGLAQAVAILPGISRSGATIAAGLFARLDRGEAGRFAFLMVAPPILGAALLDALRPGAEIAASGAALAVGVLAAYASGVFALRLLLSFVRHGRLHHFATWCLLVGGATLLLGRV
jgi:undecaprenyl-diphosphatase